MSDSLKSSGLSLKKKEYLALAIIMLLAIFLRFYQLEAIPVGIGGDEGADGFGAKRILTGEELPVFFTLDFGEEPMHTYLVASSFALWGISLWAIRFVSALVGVLTIPAIFWLAKELFPADEGSSPLMAILSAFWVATSYWHIIYSRSGLEILTLPLFSSAMTYFLWRGIRSEKRWPFLVAGLLLGASLNAYRGARFLPIFLAIIFSWWLVSEREFRRRHFANLTLLVAVAALVLTPLAIYAIGHPDIFFAREMHVFVFGSEAGRGTPIRDFAEALVRTMGMFNFQGDARFDLNPGRRPVLDPISSLCFFIGLAIALRRWKRPNYLFVLLWFLIMALPGAFTFEHLPSFNRGIGALPPLCLLSAMGVVSLKEWLERRISWRGARQTLWAILSFILISTTFLSCRDYFVPWQQPLAKGEVIGSTYMEATAVMNRTRIRDGVWILPATSLRPRMLAFYEVDFLYDGPEPEYTLNVDEETAAAELSEICQGHRQAAVVNWKYYTLEEAYTSWNSDPKGLLDFLLRKYGRRTGEEPFESFDLVAYELPDSPDFAIARSFEPLDVNFGDELRLVGIAFGGSSLNPTSTPEEVEKKILPSGKSGWVVLRWRGLNPMAIDYKVGIYLLDDQGHLVGQMDKLLLSNYLRPTSQWEPGQVEIDYYTLPSLPATPPGEYHIEVAVYDPESLERLPILGETVGRQTFTIGSLQIVEPLLPPEVEPQVELEVEMAPGIRLLGYDIREGVVPPGDMIHLILYWEALDRVERDYLLSLELRDGANQIWGKELGRPVDGNYPTTEWDKGEVLRDWHDIRLTADAPSGSYGVVLRLLEKERMVEEVELGSFEVRGRPRQFAIPKIQHPSEARLGEGVRFLGHDLSSDQVRAGNPLQLTLYWQALEEMEVSYTVFTHLLDTEERIWGQKDGVPGSGTLPTTSWVEGEIITDQYELMVDPEAPAGAYLIEVGIYLAETGVRLPVSGTEGEFLRDRILLPSTIEVTP